MQKKPAHSMPHARRMLDHGGVTGPLFPRPVTTCRSRAGHVRPLTGLAKCTQNARRLHAKTLVKGLRLAGQMLGQCLQKAGQMRSLCETNAQRLLDNCSLKACPMLAKS